MISLRPYQTTQMIEPVRQAFRDKFKAPLLVAPTGSGKTRVFSSIVHGAQQRGNVVAILAHRIELIDQIHQALSDVEVECDVIAAGYARRRAPVMLCSVQTLVRRLNDVPVPDLVVIDEAHHARAGSWEEIFKAWSAAKRLGVTATPIRASGEGLATMFDKLVLGPTVEALTPEYLAPARVWAPPTIDISGLHTKYGEYLLSETEARSNKPSVTGDALWHYKQHADGKPALVFCVSIKHAADVAQQFRKAGYRALMMKGGMDRELRREALANFRRGALQVITSCDIFVEGVDLPGAHVGIILRPTQSLGLWRQMCGRLLRPCPGKEFAVILDHAGNCERFGRPIDEPTWALTYDETRRKRKAAISVRVCPSCFAASSSRALLCCNCGAAFKVAPRSKVVEKDGELVEITDIQRKTARREQGRIKSLDELREFGRSKGYRPGWAEHVFAGRAASK
jgi:superfamily II DNA or RNA helicase